MRLEFPAEGSRPQGSSPSGVHLRLLVTTDLHAHIFPYNYYTDQRFEGVGLARTATLIRAARAEVPNCLVLDNGDFLQGTPLGDYVAETMPLTQGRCHPVISAMNAAGIEVATLGNHEFNYGLAFLQNALKGAAFPVVSANILQAGSAPDAPATPLLAPFVCLDRDVTDASGRSRRLRIGVIGFAPPQTPDWDRAVLGDRIQSQDIREAARLHLPRLRAAGADVIVALCHSGFGAPDPAPMAENAALGLARDGGIDALCAGHAHLVFPSADFEGCAGLDTRRGTAAGVPAVMPGANGSQLGVMDLWLEPDAERWHVAASRSHIREIAPTPGDIPPPLRYEKPGCDPGVKADALDAHKETLRHVRRPIGRLADPVASYFAMVAPCACATLVARAQLEYVARHLSDTALRALPLVSAAAGFKTGGRGGPTNYTDVPAGDLWLRHATDLYPFPNRVCALRVSGADLLDWLERAAGMFAQVTRGVPDQTLLDPRFPPYNFDLIFGLRYDIDLSVPARFAPDGALTSGAHRRIRNVRHAGQPVLPDQAFLLATNDYRAGGGGQFPGAARHNIVLESRELSRQVLIDYLGEERSHRPEPSGAQTWSFTPLPGTSVLFDTGPGAVAFLPYVQHLDLEPLHVTPAGFQRYRLRL
jgi:2',3'-cyclic-nucleotide 2'-phosphodiesterase/3'-nucleotidase